MNLLSVLTSYPPATGGAQALQHQLAGQLRQRHAVQVVCQWDTNRSDWLVGTTLRAPGTARDYVIDGVPVHRIGLSRWEKLAIAPYLPIYYPLMDMALPPVAAVLERHLQPFAARADLVHAVRIGREGLYAAALHVAQRRGIPFVLTPVHHPRWRGWRYRVYDRLYRAADLVFALTTAESRILETIGVRPERIVVAGMGPVLAPRADGDRFRREQGIDGPVVLFLGQHYPYKGYRQVLEAAPLVWRVVPEAQFVFAGPPVGRSEQAFAALPDRRIRRLGMVDLQTKTDALAACALLCVPSTQESFGGVYVEAWSMDKPVIGCPIPAVAEVICDGEDGLLVSQTPAAIADAILTLLRDEPYARRLGAAGRLKVATRYTWERLAARTEAGYRAVCSGH